MIYQSQSHVKTDILEKFVNKVKWISEENRRLDVRLAFFVTYKTFARRYPQWAASLFDEHFFIHHVTPLLERSIRDSTPLDPAEIAAAWTKQMGIKEEKMQELINEMIPVASEFLHLLGAEIRSVEIATDTSN
jgi:hypothetical protein